MIANNVDIKLLVKSRNRLPSTPAVQLDTNEVLISAWIDIMEPLMCYPHEVKNVPFQYRSGIPFAHAFGIAWYLTETDAEANENQLTTGIPQATIYPSPTISIGCTDIRRTCASKGTFIYDTQRALWENNYFSGIITYEDKET